MYAHGADDLSSSRGRACDGIEQTLDSLIQQLITSPLWNGSIGSLSQENLLLELLDLLLNLMILCGVTRRNVVIRHTLRVIITNIAASIGPSWNESVMTE